MLVTKLCCLNFYLLSLVTSNHNISRRALGWLTKFHWLNFILECFFLEESFCNQCAMAQWYLGGLLSDIRLVIESFKSTQVLVLCLDDLLKHCDMLHFKYLKVSPSPTILYFTWIRGEKRGGGYVQLDLQRARSANCSRYNKA